MADEGTGRPIGTSPSVEFAQLSGSTASAPGIIITGTAAATALTIHTADAQAIDVLFVTIYNNSANTVTVYGQLGTTASTSAIPLSLSPKSSGVLFNGAPISNAGVVGVWNDTATTGIVAVGSVGKTYL